MTHALPGCGTSLDDAEPASALQDYIFYLEPERLESGKGKCPYDPKLDTASALISECPHPPSSTLVLQLGRVASAYGGEGGTNTYPRVKMMALNPCGGAPPGRGKGYSLPQRELSSRD